PQTPCNCPNVKTSCAGSPVDAGDSADRPRPVESWIEADGSVVEAVASAIVRRAPRRSRGDELQFRESILIVREPFIPYSISAGRWRTCR
ncbi:MAG: hypothetical protein ACRDLR_09765, partial [Gaiellaceae bacterium]